MENGQSNVLSAVNLRNEVLVPDRSECLWLRQRSRDRNLVDIDGAVRVYGRLLCLGDYPHLVTGGKVSRSQVFGSTDRYLHRSIEEDHRTVHNLTTNTIPGYHTITQNLSM